MPNSRQITFSFIEQRIGPLATTLKMMLPMYSIPDYWAVSNVLDGANVWLGHLEALLISQLIGKSCYKQSRSFNLPCRAAFLNFLAPEEPLK